MRNKIKTIWNQFSFFGKPVALIAIAGFLFMILLDKALLDNHFK